MWWSSLPLFSISSLSDSDTFTKMVHQGGSMLEKMLERDIYERNPQLVSRAFREETRKRAEKMCWRLKALRSVDVEEVIFGEYHLKDDRLMTCLVPYQYAVNIILRLLPTSIKEKCIKDIQMIESRGEAFGCTSFNEPGRSLVTKNRWINWVDDDIYPSSIAKYFSRVKKDGPATTRIGVVGVFGHESHGKTAVLNALQGTEYSTTDRLVMTQGCEAFCICRPGTEDYFSFIDTPGSTIFKESRFFAHTTCDYALLVISVMDGLQSQSYEAVKVALNVDTPLIVVFTKTDLILDAKTERRMVNRLLHQLSMEGLDISIVGQDDILPQNDDNGELAKHSAHPSEQASIIFEKEFMCPMKKLYPNSYAGSLFKPVLNLRRKCLGICVSAKKNKNISQLWKLIGAVHHVNQPRCFHDSIYHTEHDGVIQAVVIDASKHLFNEENFRLNRQRQKLQRIVDKRDSKHRNENRISPKNALFGFFDAAKRKASSRSNRTSTNCLVLTIVVKEGVVVPGMNFVADQAEGRVEALFDYWGNSLDRVTPGMCATLVDLHNRSGCPGAGCTLISTRNESTRFRVQRYRQMLQWFVEAFPQKLHLLRPRGMDTRFSNVGNYGQLGMEKDNLEYQVLYGKPVANSCAISSGNGENKQIAQEGSSSNELKEEENSVGEYLIRKNEEERSYDPTKILIGCESSQVEATPITYTRGKGTLTNIPRMLSVEDQAAVESMWLSMQPSKPCKTVEEYNSFVESSLHIGVLLKVDSWHSARMLSREILRWGTRSVLLQVVGVRFGPLCVDDILFFGNAAKIILCYRTPLSNSVDLDNYIESQDTWVLQTDQIGDVILFAKWCSVSLHKENEKLMTSR